MTNPKTSIKIPASKFSQECNIKSREYGKVLSSADFVEVISSHSIYNLKEYLQYLELSEIPYMITQAGDMLNPPVVKKCVPELKYVKEIPCYTCTGDSDYIDEDGIIKVSEISEIIDSPNLKETLKKLVAARSFDNISVNKKFI